LITDDTVDALYSGVVEKSLISSGYSVIKFVFSHGEQSKNLETYGKILNFLAQNGVTRTDCVVALGGGVTGDMAGFVSATYLRGIKCVQIPTTLLAQIDSSVGGKTAVDLPAGKNLVGAFCQPKLVLCDVDTLSTLPDEIYRDGMGEVAKYALLDKKIYSLINGGDYQIEDLIYRCVDYKRQIVEKDEFEGGLRRLLNLGHTPAHGIERLSNYTIPHGKAVAMGLNIVVENACKHGYIAQSTKSEMLSAISKCAGELTLPYSVKDILENALTDKKRSGDSIAVIMPYGIGDAREVKIEVGKLWGYLT
jgi:3-dehydroquinate synthase